MAFTPGATDNADDGVELPDAVTDTANVDITIPNLNKGPDYRYQDESD